eukprot:NODE_10134_length_1374_cov_10.595830.p1 GENE.NODE_10134_length_1374_cov_10.595830~~NODE_10134_length_1374_cov_10.595830.p1  ORF type:complete len:356 (-),score=65.39 NODE_10134_length_1374_cov_10.595830:202-1269(-)
MFQDGRMRMDQGSAMPRGHHRLPHRLHNKLDGHSNATLTHHDRPEETSPTSSQVGLLHNKSPEEQLTMPIGFNQGGSATTWHTRTDGTYTNDTDSLTDQSELDLPETIWCIVLVAAVGGLRFDSGEKMPFSVLFAYVCTVALGLLQVVLIFLIIHDIDPQSPPVSETWTVNLMKWLMTTVVASMLTTEASQCMEIFLTTMKVPPQMLHVRRPLIFAISVFHYLIVLSVTFGGVCVVLSCQHVPDILYNSLAITFITGMDELFFTLVRDIMSLSPDLKLTLHSIAEQIAESGDEEGGAVELSFLHTGRRTRRVTKTLLIIPTIFAFVLVTIACHIGEMPSKLITDLVPRPGKFGSS